MNLTDYTKFWPKLVHLQVYNILISRIFLFYFYFCQYFDFTNFFFRLRRRTSSEEAKRKEREARSIAIEKAYVHDVYEQISGHVADNRYRAWPRVKEFIQDLEPGSIICDVGKINRIYTQIYPNLLKFTQNITEAGKKNYFWFFTCNFEKNRAFFSFRGIDCTAMQQKKRFLVFFFFYMRLLLKLDFL